MGEKETVNETGIILVVEDSLDSINVIRTTLEEAGYRVLIATTGESAFERIKINLPDLILLDILLPGIDGYETCKRIKSEKKWADIPIIFLSALSDPYDKVIGFEAGAVDYLIKPYSAEELLARVKTHLNVSRLHKQVVVYSKELEERIQDLDSFTYSVSHDLRNPIRALDGYAHLLSMHTSSEKSQDFFHYLTKIHENIRIMDQLIEDLLRFSRMSRKQIDISNIDMNALVHAVVHEIQESYPTIPFEIFIEEIPPAIGDPHLIRQVYINLVSNAMKFSKNQKNPEIHIGYTEMNSIGEYFVKDNGIGFDMKYADKIFDVFFQLHKVDEYEGTGVGLAIVKRILAKHNGKIRVYSKEGSGTCFYFNLGEK